jgi:hypothetical protein
MDLGEHTKTEEHEPGVFVPEEFPQSVPESEPVPVEATA